MFGKRNIQCSEICSTLGEKLGFDVAKKDYIRFTGQKISRCTLQHYSSCTYTDLHNIILSALIELDVCGGHGQSHDPQTL